MRFRMHIALFCVIITNNNHMPDDKTAKIVEANKFGGQNYESAAMPPERFERAVETGESKRKTEQIERAAAGETRRKENVPPVFIPVGTAAPRAKLQKQVESVLSQGLSEIYLSLDPAKRAEFKKAGEKTAEKISRLLESAKINMRKIIALIKKWLMTIPGVNRYFLEQEAKIKADEIVKMKIKNEE